MSDTTTIDDAILISQQLENENRQLRAKLEQSEQTMSEMGRHMELQKTRTRQLIAGWKLKLEEGDEKVATLSKEKDQQLTSLLSQLMFFEGCLKRERANIVEKMNAKNLRIQVLEKNLNHQKRQIDALNRANERLLTSLHGTLEDRQHDKPEDSSSDDSSTDSHGSNSNCNTVLISPPMARRKSSMPMMSYTNGHSDNVSRNRDSRQRQQLSSHMANHLPPDSLRRRVRFDAGVQNAEKCEDTDSENDKIQKYNGPLRKISLPAYRLPTDKEGSVRYF